MWFKNLTLYRVDPNTIPNDLDAALGKLTLRSPGPMESFSRGFISPHGSQGEALSHAVADYRLVVLGLEERLLPPVVVNAELAARLEAIEAERGRRVGGRERSNVKDQVMAELMPRAFIKPSRLEAYLDLKKGYVVVNSASAKAAETVLTALRDAFDSFPAEPLEPGVAPSARLTGYLAGDPLPDDFQLGDECELKDPADQGAIVRCRRQDLSASEIAEHLKAGKVASQLGLIYDERVSFVLDAELKLRKLKFLDLVTDSLDQSQQDSAAAELDARFALMTLELDRLLQRLGALFEFADS